MRWIVVLVALGGCADVPPVEDASLDQAPEPPGVLIDVPWIIDELPNGTATLHYTMKVPDGTECSWSHAVQVADPEAFRMSTRWSVDGYVRGSTTDNEYEGGGSGFEPPVLRVRTPQGTTSIGGQPGTLAPFAYRVDTTGTVHGDFSFWLAVSGLGHWNSTLVEHLVEVAIDCPGATVLQRMEGSEFHLFTPADFGDGVWAHQYNAGLGAHAMDGHDVDMASPVVESLLRPGIYAAGVIERRYPGGEQQIVVPTVEPVLPITGGPGRYGATAHYAEAGMGLWASYIGLAPVASG